MTYCMAVFDVSVRNFGPLFVRFHYRGLLGVSDLLTLQFTEAFGLLLKTEKLDDSLEVLVHPFVVLFYPAVFFSAFSCLKPFVSRALLDLRFRGLLALSLITEEF